MRARDRVARVHVRAGTCTLMLMLLRLRMLQLPSLLLKEGYTVLILKLFVSAYSDVHTSTHTVLILKLVVGAHTYTHTLTSTYSVLILKHFVSAHTYSYIIRKLYLHSGFSAAPGCRCTHLVACRAADGAVL